MDLDKVVQLQREFDEGHALAFPWSQKISPEADRQLMHICLSLAGEVGELANVVKKYERGDLLYDDMMDLIPGEIADIFIYLVKLSYQANINLEEAFLEKLEVNRIRFAGARKDK